MEVGQDSTGETELSGSGFDTDFPPEPVCMARLVATITRITHYAAMRLST
jgi:hypothetical protein